MAAYLDTACVSSRKVHLLAAYPNSQHTSDALQVKHKARKAKAAPAAPAREPELAKTRAYQAYGEEQLAQRMPPVLELSLVPVSESPSPSPQKLVLMCLVPLLQPTLHYRVH